MLAGDYLLARASVLLAKLDNVNVVQIMASALDSLVQGEIMQIKSTPDETLKMTYYLRKSYYKTASLICDACKVFRCHHHDSLSVLAGRKPLTCLSRKRLQSCAILGGHDLDSSVTIAAEKFGYHLGLAYQVHPHPLNPGALFWTRMTPPRLSRRS